MREALAAAAPPRASLRCPVTLDCDIGVGIVERVAHAGLGGEMDDAVDAGSAPARSCDHRPCLGDVGVAEGEALVRAAAGASRASFSATS